MPLSFNTAGPCIPGEHYMLPPERRLGRVLELIEERKYFTLSAGRQVGKTTSAQWLMDHFNQGDHFSALWVDVQNAAGTPDPARAWEAIKYDLDLAADTYLPHLGRAGGEPAAVEPAASFILRYLRDLSARSPRPLVVLFDEADGLAGDAMVSFLTQLRQGYLSRAKVPFPASIVLMGQRHVRDYALSTQDRRAVVWLGTSSPFNVTAEATTIGSFTEPEVAELLAQHTTATGQPFEPEAVRRSFELGQGHPWLTNALASQIVGRDLRGRLDPIARAHVDAAKETIIVERRSHIDSLIARLREPRVRRILDPMLAGERLSDDVLDDDVAYVRGLGIVTTRKGHLEIANPIYREVIPRALTYLQQLTIAEEPESYVRPDGSLDMPRLMTGWQQFWRTDGHLAAAGFLYREAGPHLMLMAFLQRIVNGGGRIEREYGFGRGALDLLIFWKDKRYAIELKLRRRTETEAEAIAQVRRYLDVAGLDEGWLLLFDLRKKLSWDKKLFSKTTKRGKARVHVVGC
jgi:hypothetical protein